MLTNSKKLLVACNSREDLAILPDMANRHGLIAGATGTGKTISLQTLAESFSSLGVPVFLADVKGDLSGLANAGDMSGKTRERVQAFQLMEKGFANRSFPVQFWDVFGRAGTPLRTTISDMGPLMLGRILGLNDVQEGVLQIVFRIADENGYLLIDIKDLKAMLQHVSDARDEYRSKYGQIAPASIGAIQRAIMRLESEGGDAFFGEPALEIRDLIRTDEKGLGVINILEAESLINAPQLYSCVLLWLLSDLYEQLPERGDSDRPRIVFFFDEAHLLFDNASPVLMGKVEQVVRLIRSKGVGIYFVSQNPVDIPPSILGQLGNRIQHALRSYSPKDRKAVKTAAETFRQNPDFSTEEAISGLGIGEALVSFLDDQGRPNIVQRASIVPPQSKIGPISAQAREEIMARSPMQKKYGASFDRFSAYESLSMEKAPESEAPKGRRKVQKHEDPGLNDIMGAIFSQATRNVGATVGREIGRTLVRGILGSLLGKK